MISKKDNLLVRPWEQRKFAYHRQKVQSALPAIDTGPPPLRAHVCVKLKKQQKEKERSQRIEQDNYLLMQRLNYIMRTSRIDNMWKTPQPNFLNRVAMYDSIVPEMDDLLALDFVNEVDDSKLKTRKSKCYACSPKKNMIEPLKIPEKRIPWEPNKKPVSKTRSKSVPVRKCQQLLPSIKEQQTSLTKPSSSKSSSRIKNVTKRTDNGREQTFSAKEPQSIIFNRGCLKLSVSFPSDTTVKFQERNLEKFLIQEGLGLADNSLHTTLNTALKKVKRQANYKTGDKIRIVAYNDRFNNPVSTTMSTKSNMKALLETTIEDIITSDQAVNLHRPTFDVQIMKTA